MPARDIVSVTLSCGRSLRATSARRQYCPPTAERRKEGQINSRSLVMEKSNKRGKIPQADWPLIMARYEAGETLASIARTYDCSPPAISYVVSKSRARQPGQPQPPREAPRPAAVGEPQLIKASAVASGGPSSVNGGGDHAAHREAAPSPVDIPPAQTRPHPDHGAGNG